MNPQHLAITAAIFGAYLLFVFIMVRAVGGYKRQLKRIYRGLLLRIIHANTLQQLGELEAVVTDFYEANYMTDPELVSSFSIKLHNAINQRVEEFAPTFAF